MRPIRAGHARDPFGSCGGHSWSGSGGRRVWRLVSLCHIHISSNVQHSLNGLFEIQRLNQEEQCTIAWPLSIQMLLFICDTRDSINKASICVTNSILTVEQLTPRLPKTSAYKCVTFHVGIWLLWGAIGVLLLLLVRWRRNYTDCKSSSAIYRTTKKETSLALYCLQGKGSLLAVFCSDRYGYCNVMAKIIHVPVYLSCCCKQGSCNVIEMTGSSYYRPGSQLLMFCGS